MHVCRSRCTRWAWPAALTRCLLPPSRTTTRRSCFATGARSRPPIGRSRAAAASLAPPWTLIGWRVEKSCLLSIVRLSFFMHDHTSASPRGHSGGQNDSLSSVYTAHRARTSTDSTRSPCRRNTVTRPMAWPRSRDLPVDNAADDFSSATRLSSLVYRLTSSLLARTALLISHLSAHEPPAVPVVSVRHAHAHSSRPLDNAADESSSATRCCQHVNSAADEEHNYSSTTSSPVPCSSSATRLPRASPSYSSKRAPSGGIIHSARFVIKPPSYHPSSLPLAGVRRVVSPQ
ncbi:uncharacterized protein B0H18DRAFT_405517 [Fomitopsis serialis]|uniref:uncharacterized protein n=1 Tax=Fomitopsis serialis TaxID=139415 RepID=UPI0020088A1D|nr:uncharacterized protein B0H18DRAFT_405517 [Neoantrodia serialis]KAH9910840.1 hypothetical protein B0H18DRAFT_405517 [Neoantrodia serialis]